MTSVSPDTAPVPLHLVLGDEELLIDRAVTGVIRQAGDGAAPGQEPTVARLRAGDVSVPELVELLSPSLFADRRVVVFEAADQAGKDPAAVVLGAAGDIPDGVTLVVVHSGGGRTKAMVPALKKLGAQVHDCAKLKASEHPAFVRAEFRAAGVRASPEVIEAVLGAVGGDLRELAAAVTQLVTDTGGKVDQAAVARYYAGRAEVSGFNVADKAVAGDGPGAAETLRWALHGGTAHVLIADALADAIHTLARVGGAGRVDPNRSAGELGMPPWKIRNAQRDLRGWTPETIADALQVVARLNGEVKGQAADPDYALERAVAEVVRLRRVTR